MPQRSDIVLGNNKTEVVGPLDIQDEVVGTVSVTDSPGGSERIQLDGSKGVLNLRYRGQKSLQLGTNGDIEAGGGKQEGELMLYNPAGDQMVTAEGTKNGGFIAVHHPSEAPVGGIFASQNSTKFDCIDPNSAATGDLQAANGEALLSLWGDNGSHVEVRTKDGGEMTIHDQDDDLTVELKSDEGGRFALRNKRGGGARGVVASAGKDGGRLSVKSGDGIQTGLLDGRDAALLLSGRPERGPEEQEHPRFGGGELVLQQGIDQPDIHVHAQGERNSDYGVDTGNRPRIYLNGPEATLELGCSRQHNRARAVPGSLVLRDEANSPLLRANAKSPKHSQRGSMAAEFVFKHGDGNGVLPGSGGAIRSHPDGLMFYDAQGNEALQITNTGEILTSKQIQQGAL